MANRLAKRRCAKYDGDANDVLLIVAPPWVHTHDPRYMHLHT